jgi:hypothetical protein
MSGQLVGEVLDAAEAGHLDGLSQGDLLALVAIAEKCGTENRQGSVRIGRIQAAMGKSKRTAVRALERLKQRGHIHVVKRGFKSHGVARASIYGLNVLAPPKVAQATDDACATQDGVSPNVLAPKRPCACAKSECACATQGGVLDGSIDGSIDGGACATDGANVPANPEPPQEIPEEEQPEPPEYCPAHMPHGTDGKCGPCGSYRKHHGKWLARRDEQIRLCGLCDVRGYVGLRAGPFINCPHSKKRIDELERHYETEEIEA